MKRRQIRTFMNSSQSRLKSLRNMTCSNTRDTFVKATTTPNLPSADDTSTLWDVSTNPIVDDQPSGSPIVQGTSLPVTDSTHSNTTTNTNVSSSSIARRSTPQFGHVTGRDHSGRVNKSSQKLLDNLDSCTFATIHAASTKLHKHKPRTATEKLKSQQKIMESSKKRVTAGVYRLKGTSRAWTLSCCS